MRRCTATTRKGKPCPIGADPGVDTCHVHNPDGTYQQQLRAGTANKPNPNKKPRPARQAPSRAPGDQPCLKICCLTDATIHTPVPHAQLHPADPKRTRCTGHICHCPR
jgi:hypothetical protein